MSPVVVVAWYGGLYLVVRAFPQCELGVIIIKPPRRARWPGWLLLEPVRLPALAHPAHTTILLRDLNLRRF